MTTQTKFEIALARAEQRAKCTDFDQHITEDESGDFVVIDEGDVNMPQWLIDQIIFTVSGKLCISDELEDIRPNYSGLDEAYEAAAHQRKIDREGDWIDEESKIAIYGAMERANFEDALLY
jgi:hypothetical protein